MKTSIQVDGTEVILELRFPDPAPSTVVECDMASDTGRRVHVSISVYDEKLGRFQLNPKEAEMVRTGIRAMIDVLQIQYSPGKT